LLAALGVLAGCAHGGGLDVWDDVEFEGPEGTDFLALEPQPDAVDLQDGYGDRFGSYALEDGVLRVRDGERHDLGFIQPAEGGEALELRESGGALLFRLEREPDGDLRLEDGSGGVLAQIKRRDDGFKIVDAGDRERARVKARRGKTSLRDPAGQTRLSTRDAIPAESIACFAFEEIPLAFQGGCSLAVVHWNFGS
jgi:hypothetical protein